ncbi:MAG: LysM peptidoglycan-binding domain-containing protein [Deltaproteobacteria bacterium]|nr:MAG: LysM peptidoglycan-binding domain-containing protein [Deltaproteobacteria bacterium]
MGICGSRSWKILSVSVLAGITLLFLLAGAALAELPSPERETFREAGPSLLHDDSIPLFVQKRDVTGEFLPGFLTLESSISDDGFWEDRVLTGEEAVEEFSTPESSGEIAESPEVEDIPLPVDLNRRVLYAIRYFQKPARKQFQVWLKRYGKYEKLIRDILIREGVPGDFVYLAMIESGFSPNAVSRAGAVGVWQFMYWTGKKYGLRIDWWVDERRDVEKATVAAARYLKNLHDMFGSWYLAAAAYNVGEGKIDRAIRRYRTKDYWKLVRYRYLPRETKNYVPKMLAALTIVKNPEKYGFDSVVPDDPISYDVVPVPGSLDLRTVASSLGIEYSLLRELNVELLRGMTPPDVDLWNLKVPAGMGERLKSLLPGIVARGKVQFVLHRVRKRDSIYRIAQKYGTSVERIKEVNGLRRNSLRGKKKVIVPVIGGGNEVARKALRRTSKKDLAYMVRTLERSARFYYLYRRGNTLVYIVKKGDSLYKIARRFGTSVSRIKRLNGIRGNIIRPGQRLVIRVFGRKIAPVRRYRKYRVVDGKKIYTVRRGDTLYDISRAFKISLEKIKRINGLQSETIYPGMKLVVGFAG